MIIRLFGYKSEKACRPCAGLSYYDIDIVLQPFLSPPLLNSSTMSLSKFSRYYAVPPVLTERRTAFSYGSYDYVLFPLL